MPTLDDLLGVRWPSEFVVEYDDGTRETLLRGDGVLLVAPADDPAGYGGMTAELPKKHARNQSTGGRWIRFSELQAIYSTDGRRLWPNA